MKVRIFVLVLLLIASAFAITSCPATGDCPDCKKLEKALQAKIFISVDSIYHIANATFYYEDTSVSPPRQPIKFATIILYVYNDSFKETYRIYSDAKGTATFDFSQYENASINMKFLYCPFTNPNAGEEGYSQCGFIQCLDYGGIDCTLAPSCLPDALPEKLKPGETVPLPIEYYNLLPAIQTATYNPPPKPLSSVPAICLPSLIIFALLGGALFLSGRNPFAGFDFSAPRIGRHIRYQARTISAGFSVPTPLTEAIKGSVAGLIGKGLGSLAGAIGGGGKTGEAMKEAAGKIMGEEGARAVRGPGGQVSLVGGGKGRSFKERLKGGFVGGKAGLPWDKYKRVLGTITGIPSQIREARVSYQAAEAIEKGSALSFSTLKNILFAMGSFDKAVAGLKDAGGSKFSFDIKGVREVKGPDGEVIGLQVLNSKGKPVEFSVGGKKADVMLDASSLREGKVSGNVIVGERNFSIKEGEIVAVSEKGKALEGKAFESAIKGFDMKDFSGQLAKADIRMETRMFSEQFGGAVTAQYNPLSVGETGDFNVIKPGSQGDANGIIIAVKSGVVDSITDLSGKKPVQITSIQGTEIKKGENLVAAGLTPGEGIGILRQAYDAHDSYNKVIDAKREFNEAKLVAVGEAFAARNPAVMKDLDKYTNAAPKIDALKMTDAGSSYIRNAPHVGIDARATQDAETAANKSAQQALSQNKDFQKAQKQYESAIAAAPGKTPKMSQDDARIKYVDPVIEKHKDAYETAYMAAYVETYKSSLKDSYVQNAEQQAGGRQKLDSQVRAELKERAYDIASQFMDKGGLQSRQDILGAIGGRSFNELREPDPANPDKTVLNKDAVHKILGKQIEVAASYYKTSHENPQNYDARELAYGSINLYSPHFREGATSGSVNADSLLRSSPTEDFKTLVQNVDNLPKGKQNEILFKSVYNLHQAAEEASKAQKKGKK